MRQCFITRGATTIATLSRTFRALDSYDGNKKLTRDELLVGLRENGMTLNASDASLLLNYFDKNGDGYINFDEFLEAVRGRLNPTRQAIVDKAFKKFDKDGSGVIEARDMKGVYSAAKHPKVLSGQMTEEEVFNEFLIKFGDKNHDGKIEKREWDDYYAGVSASVDNDEHFVLSITNAWRL